MNIVVQSAVMRLNFWRMWNETKNNQLSCVVYTFSGDFLYIFDTFSREKKMTKKIKKQIQDLIWMILYCVMLSLIWNLVSFETAVLVALAQIVAKVESWDIGENND